MRHPNRVPFVFGREINLMKRIAIIMAAFLCLAAPSWAQTVTVAGTNISNLFGTKLAKGRACFQGTTNKGIPISFRSGGGAQVTYPPGGQGICSDVTAGVFSVAVPDTSLTDPKHVCYHLTIKDLSTNQLVLGQSVAGKPSGYDCLQPEANNDWCVGGACNFDNYIPILTGLALETAGPPGPGLIPCGVWDIVVNYEVGCFVYYSGHSYAAILANIGQQPDISPTYWQLADPVASTTGGRTCWPDLQSGVDGGAKIISCLSILGGVGKIDSTGLVGAQTATSTISVPAKVKLEIGAAQWTMGGCPNIDLHGDGAAVIGPTGTPLKTAQIINSTATCDTISWHDGLGMEVGNLDLEIAAGVTRTAGAGLHADASTASTGHGHVHDLVINTAPYKILEDHAGSQFGLVEHIEMGGYAPINDANLIAGIWIGVADPTAALSGATIASEQYNNIKANTSVAGCPSDSMIHIDSGVDTLEMVNVDVGHVPNCIFTGFKMMDWSGAANPGAGGRAPRFSRFVNFSMEGNGLPAGIFGGSNSNQFVNSSWASGEQPTPADHTLVIDNTAGGTIKSLSFLGGQVNSGATKEAVYTAWNPVAQFYGLKFIGMNIGDSSENNANVYCHMYFAPDLSDFWVVDTHFHNIFGSPTTPLCSINVAAGTGDRIIITDNNFEGSPNGLIFNATGANVTASGNIGAGSNNNFTRSSGVVRFDSAFRLGGPYHSGLLTFENPAAATAQFGMHSTQTANTIFYAPITNCSSGTVWEWQGPSNPAICTVFPTTSNFVDKTTTQTGISGQKSFNSAGAWQIALGSAGVSGGSLALNGFTTGFLTIEAPPSPSGSPRFVLPTTAGNIGDGLTSSGGAGSPMTWTAPLLIYSAPQTGVTMSAGTGVVTTGTGTGCVSGVCTMTTPAVDGTYRFVIEAIITTAGVGCSSGTLRANILYRNSENLATYTDASGMSMAFNGSGVVARDIVPNVIALSSALADLKSVSIEFGAKAGTAIQYDINQTAASVGCSTFPILTFRPRLYGPLG